MEDNINKIIEDSENYAVANGFILNPDKAMVERLARGLASREEKFGARYCPCRLMTQDKEEDKKIICPCVYHKEEIERDGHCYCQLFYKN